MPLPPTRCRQKGSTGISKAALVRWHRPLDHKMFLPFNGQFIPIEEARSVRRQSQWQAAPTKSSNWSAPPNQRIVEECLNDQLLPDAKKAAFGPECVKTSGQTLAMISEIFIARGTHETVYPR